MVIELQQFAACLGYHLVCVCTTGTLNLFEADLLIDGSFDEVVRGSHYVFHVASPLPAPGVCRLLNMHAGRGITGCAVLMAPSAADAEPLHPAMTYPLTAAKRS